MSKRLLLIAGMLAVVSIPSFANVITLDFEGLKDQEEILNYYNGGTGSLGSGPGTNYGISFTSDSLSLIAQGQGGTGNFSNNPSGKTIAFFVSGAGDTMNMAAGFTTGFSFYYTSTSFVGDVQVWSGQNGTGSKLADLSLPALGGCSSTPNFCDWAPIGVTFAGTADSVIFTGTAGQIGFDNITLGSSTAGGSVPEPTSVVLLGSALLAAGAALRKKIA